MQGQNNTAGNPLIAAVPVSGKSLYSLANGKEINAIHHFVPLTGSAALLPLSNSNRGCFALPSLSQPYYFQGKYGSETHEGGGLV